jgi:hypothetical protein
LISSGTVGGQWIFVHDRYACGRRFRILNAGDDVTQECLAAIPGTSISCGRVARQAKHDRLRQWNHVTWAQDDRIVRHLIAPRTR